MLSLHPMNCSGAYYVIDWSRNPVHDVADRLSIILRKGFPVYPIKSSSKRAVIARFIVLGYEGGSWVYKERRFLYRNNFCRLPFAVCQYASWLYMEQTAIIGDKSATTPYPVWDRPDTSEVLSPLSYWGGREFCLEKTSRMVREVS